MLRLSQLRAEKGLTQNELASDLKIAQNTLSQYETGKREPDLETLLKIARYFGVTVDYLMGAESQEQKRETKSPFQNNLITLREKAGLSQQQLAKELGVSQSTVGMWESGKNHPEYLTLIKIARYFGVSVDRLASDPAQRDPDAPTVVYMDGGDGPVIHQKPEGKKGTEREEALDALLKAANKLSTEQIKNLLPIINSMNPEK